MTRSVRTRQSVGRSVGRNFLRGKLRFHAPIGAAIIFSNSPVPASFSPFHIHRKQQLIGQVLCDTLCVDTVHTLLFCVCACELPRHIVTDVNHHEDKL